MELCRDLGIQAILLEGDAKEIVYALEHEGGALGRYGSIVADTRSLLSNFHSWLVKYVRREGNEVAHKLA